MQTHARGTFVNKMVLFGQIVLLVGISLNFFFLIMRDRHKNEIKMCMSIRVYGGQWKALGVSP